MPLDNSILIQQVEELAKILKPWNNELVIGGGVALILYDVLLSKANTGAVGTLDIDFLIPRKIVNPINENISQVLIANGYEVKNKSFNSTPVQSYIKQIEDTEIEVEFLTDNKTRIKTDTVEIEHMGVNAQALSYIEMSLRKATPITLPNKTSILVVKPEAWVFHKGLTFTKRNIASKKYKDLYGIWFVLTQLGTTSPAVQKNLRELMADEQATWAKTFRSNLKSWMENASPRDWDLLQRQDANSELTEANFRTILKMIKE